MVETLRKNYKRWWHFRIDIIDTNSGEVMCYHRRYYSTYKAHAISLAQEYASDLILERKLGKHFELNITPLNKKECQLEIKKLAFFSKPELIKRLI